MSNFRGTKSPWRVIESTCGLITETQCINIQVGEDDIITVWDNSEESQANALLISKAPEMLEMLEKVKSSVLIAGDMELYREVEQLIKSATDIDGNDSDSITSNIYNR